jgi:hypothetical protein
METNRNKKKDETHSNCSMSESGFPISCKMSMTK